MSLYLNSFQPSDEELQLAEKLLETSSWNRSDTLRIETAIRIFNLSGFSFKQVRDIWTIADKNGTGNLSKEELTVVIRLMGWVQNGRPLDESLLGEKGPLPRIRGITETTDEFAPWTNKGLSVPSDTSTQLQTTSPEPYNRAKHSTSLQPSAPLPQITAQAEVDINLFMEKVEQNRTIEGKLASMFQSVYGLGPSDIAKLWEKSSMDSKRTVSPERLRRMRSLLRDKLHSIESARLPIISRSETRTLRPINNSPFAQSFMSAEEEKERLRRAYSKSKPNSTGLPQSTAPILQIPMSPVYSLQSINHPPPPQPYMSAADEKEMLRRHQQNLDHRQSLLRRTTISRTPTLQPPSNVPPAQSFASAAEEQAILRQSYTDRELYDRDPLQSPVPSLTSPQLLGLPGLPEYTVFETPLRWSPPPPLTTGSVGHQGPIHLWNNGIDDLKNLLESVLTGQASMQSDLQESVRLARHHSLRGNELEAELSRQKTENVELQKVFDSLTLTALEQQVLASEYREEKNVATGAVEELRATITVQNQQIDALTELLTEMEGEISKDTKQIDSHDLRLRFLRASLQQALEAKSRAELEIADLRSTITTQETELAALRSKVAILEQQTQVSVTHQVSVLQQRFEQQNELLEAKIRGLQDTMTRYQPSKSVESATQPQPSTLKRSDAMRHHPPSTAMSSPYDPYVPQQSSRGNFPKFDATDNSNNTPLSTPSPIFASAIRFPTDAFYSDVTSDSERSPSTAMPIPYDPYVPQQSSWGNLPSFDNPYNSNYTPLSIPSPVPVSPVRFLTGAFYSDVTSDSEQSTSSRSSLSQRTIRHFGRHDSTSISSPPTTPSPMRMSEDSQYLSRLEGDLFLLKSDISRKGYIGPDVVQRFLTDYDISPEDLTDFGMMAEVEIDVATTILRRKVKTSRRHHVDQVPFTQDSVT